MKSGPVLGLESDQIIISETPLAGQYVNKGGTKHLTARLKIETFFLGIPAFKVSNLVG